MIYPGYHFARQRMHSTTGIKIPQPRLSSSGYWVASLIERRCCVWKPPDATTVVPFLNHKLDKIGSKMNCSNAHVRTQTTHTALLLFSRNLRVTWEITALGKSGWEGTFEHSHAHFSELAVTVCWSGSSWPSLQHLSHLQLHGVMRVPLNCPNFIK